MSRSNNTADNSGRTQGHGHCLLNIVHRPSQLPHTTTKQVILALLFLYVHIPNTAAQRRQHQRLWPPENIEPCSLQCLVQHVLMTGNRTSGTEMTHWGAQPIYDFMSNSQWQTAASSPQPTMLAADVVASSSITTFRTSLISVALSTKAVRSQQMVMNVAYTSTAGQAEGPHRVGLAHTLFVFSSGVLLTHWLM